jgi:glycosyltransferase involved in cell wall biosynthesis
VKILCAKIKKELKGKEDLGYAEVLRFKVCKFKIPLIGMNNDYLSLARSVKKYFRENPPKEDDLFLANGRASLGIPDKRYCIRMGQPALVFLKNMEIANDQVSIFTKAARKVHFNFQHVLEKKAFQNSSMVISSSQESLLISQKTFDKAGLPYLIPHSGVKYYDLQKGKKLYKEGKYIIFVSAGEEKVRKGVLYLEKALPEIFKQNKEVFLLHVGDRFEWDVPDWCRKRIISVGRIPWDNMKDYYASSTMLITCALNEWIPNAVFEAMAAGIPIVSSDIEGIGEYITHKKTGYIYKRGEIEGIKKGVSFVLGNPKEMAKAKEILKEKAIKIEYFRFSKNLLELLESNLHKTTKKSINLQKNA